MARPDYTAFTVSERDGDGPNFYHKAGVAWTKQSGNISIQVPTNVALNGTILLFKADRDDEGPGPGAAHTGGRKPDMRAVTITEVDNRSFFNDVGAAWKNARGFTIRLNDGFSVSGSFMLVEPRRDEQSDARTAGTDRDSAARRAPRRDR